MNIGRLWTPPLEDTPQATLDVDLRRSSVLDIDINIPPEICASYRGISPHPFVVEKALSHGIDAALVPDVDTLAEERWVDMIVCISPGVHEPRWLHGFRAKAKELLICITPGEERRGYTDPEWFEEALEVAGWTVEHKGGFLRLWDWHPQIDYSLPNSERIYYLCS